MPKDGPPKPRPNARQELGETSGLYLDGLVRSEDYNRKLVGTAAIDIFNEMRLGDATVRASLLIITLPILAARWHFDAASESRQDEKIAEFVEDDIFTQGTRTWTETLSEILLYLAFGRMPFELVWQFRQDGMIGLRKMASRWPTTIWKWKLDNGEDGIVQQTLAKGRVEIPMDKLAIFVNQKEGENWEGVSLLRSAYKHWLMKHKMYIIDAMAMERQGLGVPYAKRIAAGVTKKNEEEDMDELLANIRANEKGYARYSSNWEVGFLDMKAGTIKNPIQMIQHHDRGILVNVLGQFLALGAGGAPGSWALSTDQSKLFLISIESVARYVCDVVNKYVVPKLVDYNFDGVKKYPELAFDKIGQVDFAKLMVAVMQGIQSGVVDADDSLKEYLRDVMDLPEQDGAALVDPGMADDMMRELNGELNQLTMANGQGLNPDQQGPEQTDVNTETLTPEEQKALADQVQAAAEDIFKSYKGGLNDLNRVVKLYGGDLVKEVVDAMRGGPAGVPLSEETKRKISIALSKGKGKGKGTGSKSNPEIQKRQAEIKKVQDQVRQFNDSVRRDLLEMRAKGIKLSPEDMAKKQLDIFDKKSKLSGQIAELRSQIESIKSQSAKPAPKAPAAAHEHLSQPTDPALLKMSEDLYDAIEKIKTTK